MTRKVKVFHTQHFRPTPPKFTFGEIVRPTDDGRKQGVIVGITNSQVNQGKDGGGLNPNQGWLYHLEAPGNDEEKSVYFEWELQEA